ncbi:MAG TPA: F0F1 ATP synthase subunit B [Solimonas sp.]|nr:F0F1 ATP synthase subunit B [Solimonas sp.]
MDINVTLVVQLVAFAIFVVGTMKLIVPHLAKVMENRQARIADGLAAAEKGAKALQDASAKSDEALKQARTQAQEILAAANRQANQLVEQAKGQAKTEAERIAEAAREEVAREVTRAREELRRTVGDLAVAGASKILKREIDAKAHADVLKDLAGRV